jgi:polysaccharide pyruvyl transferase WcaK-like protein
MNKKQDGEQIIKDGGHDNLFRVGIISPYTGGNLGDAAIIESTQNHISRKFASAQFLLIVLYSEQVEKLHGIESFPLTAVERPFYYNPKYSQRKDSITRPEINGIENQSVWIKMKKALNYIPFVKPIYHAIKMFIGSIKREMVHCFKVWNIVHKLNMLVVAGGGQFDDEYGGAWGHPYSMFKWINLASIAKVPVFFAGVGVCEIRYKLTRYFLRKAVKKAQRVSLRDWGSVKILRNVGIERELYLCPDLVFGLFGDKRRTEGKQRFLKNKTVVGISPIIFGRRGSWPTENMPIYDRYRREIIDLGLGLLHKDYSLAIFVTDYADFNLAEDLYKEYERISGRKNQLLLIPMIRPSKLISHLRDCNLVIASRLHGILLSYISEIPVIGISYHRKVVAHMEDMGQLNYCFGIETFKAEDIENKVEEILNQKGQAIKEIVKLASARYSDVKREFDIIGKEF